MAASSHPAGMYADEDIVIDSTPFGRDRDNLIFALVSKHPWVKNSPGSTVQSTAEGDWQVEYVNLSINTKAVYKYLEERARRSGKDLPDEYREVGDDVAYSCTYDAASAALSYILRKYLTRGFTHFKIKSPTTRTTHSLVIRGLNKFTGLTSADEDEDSAAADLKDLFFAEGSSYRECDTLGVSVKSNGENAKGAVRLLDGVVWMFAGSKNTCLACPFSVNPRTAFPDDNPEVPAPRILHAWFDFLRSLEGRGQFDEFVALVSDNDYVFMMELNDPNHEHIVPIHSLFVEAFAIRGQGDLAIPPSKAFDIFDKYALRRVQYTEHPASQLENVIAATRALTDTEGVVIYFLVGDRVVGALKCKTDFYTIARAIRQKFWRIPDTLGRASGGGRGRGRGSSSGAPNYTLRSDLVDKVCDSITDRMQNMHLPNADVMWPEWNRLGTGFVRWWADSYGRLANDEQRKAACETAKDKFATVYKQYLDNVAAESSS